MFLMDDVLHNYFLSLRPGKSGRFAFDERPSYFYSQQTQNNGLFSYLISIVFTSYFLCGSTLGIQPSSSQPSPVGMVFSDYVATHFCLRPHVGSQKSRLSAVEFEAKVEARPMFRTEDCKSYILKNSCHLAAGCLHCCLLYCTLCSYWSLVFLSYGVEYYNCNYSCSCRN